MSAAQVGFGLYGALLVEDPNAASASRSIDAGLERHRLRREGRLEPADSGGSAGMVFGREGDFVLANGRHRPVLRPDRARRSGGASSTPPRAGSSTRSRRPAFTVIGADGGIQERPLTADMLLVTPGERVDVLWRPKGKAGTPLPLRAMLYNRGYGSVEYRGVEDVLTIEFTNEAPVKAAPIMTSRALPVPSIDGATPVDVVLTLPPMKNNTSEFQVNGAPFWKAKPFVAKLGEKQLWIVRNESDWDHPFHLHGFFFHVIDDKGAGGPAAGAQRHRQRAHEIDRAAAGDVQRAPASGCSTATSSITPTAD